jgi:hypothetical protein
LEERCPELYFYAVGGVCQQREGRSARRLKNGSEKRHPRGPVSGGNWAGPGKTKNGGEIKKNMEEKVVGIAFPD